MNINPAYRTHELEYALRQSEAQGLLLMDRFKTSDYVKMFYEVCPEAKESKPGNIHSDKLTFLRTAILIGGEKQPGMYSWNEAMKMGQELPDDVLLEIQRT